MPNPFPEHVSKAELIDFNPAIQLFGLRFFVDQTNLEFLTEFLLVAFSNKKIEETDQEFSSPLPSYELLLKWPRRRELSYAPKAKLNLKLFSFLGSSKLDTRHKTHREHLKTLDELLKNNIIVDNDSEENVIRTLENLFLGFQGAGSQRTWCAQSFAPVCQGFLSSETLWNETVARKNSPNSWEDIINRFTTYFSVNKHRFLARGGEVLYLQICNALRQNSEKITEWAQNSGLAESLTSSELNPKWLHERLNCALEQLMQVCPKTLTDIADFIDSGVENKTSAETDFEYGQPSYTECGWCPAESWQEGYLFAVEVLRICQAELDLIERLDLLEMACAFQVMRSLMMQAERQLAENDNSKTPYLFAVSDPIGDNRPMRQISRETLGASEKLIYDALRVPDIQTQILVSERVKLYREADRRYGHKLFVNIAKRIGFIVPRRGTGMRFVLNEKILRFLVITLVPSKRLTYDSFKKFAELHFRLALDEDTISRASRWATGISIESFENKPDEWLQDMLEASGILRRLSDSCAMVENPSGVDQ